jgi:hypothetical protein
MRLRFPGGYRSHPRTRNSLRTLCNARRAEGVGLDNVRAGFEKAAIDVADYLRLRQREEVTVVEKAFCGVLEAVPTDVRFAGLSIKSPRA